MGSENLIKFITNFGDEAVILPLIFVTTILFSVAGWIRGALVWFFGVSLTVGCIILVKMFGLLWAEWYGGYGRSFSLSGHVAAITVVYGSLLHIFIFSRFRSWLIAALPPIVIAVILSYTRLYLMAHTLAEVVAGTSLGVIGAVVTERFTPESPDGLMRWCMPVILMVMFIFHGYVLEAEPALQRIFHVSYLSINQVIGW